MYAVLSIKYIIAYNYIENIIFVIDVYVNPQVNHQQRLRFFDDLKRWDQSLNILIAWSHLIFGLLYRVKSQ